MSNDPQNDPETGASDEPDLSAVPASNMLDRMPKIVPFEQLARCGEEIWIECDGQIYRLRKTRKGKLILTK
jgi:hemin uptake protein HemP